MKYRNEAWKDITGFEGYYQVSNLGNVRRIKPGKSTYTGRNIGSTDPVDGYRKVCLYKSGIKKQKKIHHLVLESFVGQRPPGMVCNHKNGVKSDNNFENLEWVTSSENTQHAFDTLNRNRPRGENHGCHVLTEKQVEEIRNLYKTGEYSQHKLADIYKVSRRAIQGVVTRTTWKHQGE